MNALEMSGAGKRYKGFALENVNLVLPEGCILGLIGENGAGKTTLIKLLLGMAQGEGEIRVLGRDIRREGAAIRQETGVVLDEACFPEGLDALQVNRVLRDTYTHWREDEFFRLLKRLSLPERKPFKESSRRRFRTRRSCSSSMSRRAAWILSCGMRFWICFMILRGMRAIPSSFPPTL